MQELPLLGRAIAANKTDALRDFRQRVFLIEFVFDRNVAVESLRFQLFQNLLVIGLEAFDVARC